MQLLLRNLACFFFCHLSGWEHSFDWLWLHQARRFRVCLGCVPCQLFCGHPLLDGPWGHPSHGRVTLRRKSRRLVTRNHLHRAGWVSKSLDHVLKCNSDFDLVVWQLLASHDVQLIRYCRLNLISSLLVALAYFSWTQAPIFQHERYERVVPHCSERQPSTVVTRLERHLPALCRCMPSEKARRTSNLRETDPTPVRSSRQGNQRLIGPHCQVMQSNPKMVWLFQPWEIEFNCRK